MDIAQKVDAIRGQFTASRRLLTAIGDDTRQAIILTLMESDCSGMRVGDITRRTHLSRPAVSHHLKILVEAGMVSVTPQGTKNFYWLFLGEKWDILVSLIGQIEELRQREFPPTETDGKDLI